MLAAFMGTEKMGGGTVSTSRDHDVTNSMTLLATGAT